MAYSPTTYSNILTGRCRYDATDPTGGIMYRITLKVGYVLTDDHGNIAEDHSAGRSYVRTPDPSWRILGFTTRAHAHRLITLAEAADGANIGQGWIHDFDHGARRMWAMPRSNRAVRVTREEA